MKMKGILRLSITFLLCIGSIHSEAGLKDEQTKSQFNSVNSLSTAQKSPVDALSYQFGARFQPQTILNQLKSQNVQDGLSYQQQQLERKQPAPAQLHQTPVAMVIIAQPVYMPASMLQQSNIAQHLLQYFTGHSLPRTNYPQLYQQHYSPVPSFSNVNHLRNLVHHQYQQPEIPSPSPSAPPAQIAQPLPQPQQLTSAPFQQQHQSESLPTPQALIAPHPNVNHNLLHGQERKILPYHPNHQYPQHSPPIPANHKPDYQQQQQQQPYELNHISQLAQQAAQRYLMSGGAGGPGGAAGAPAIITGLENFSPEHQQKIKAQLSTYFGAPLQPLNFDDNQKREEKTYDQKQQQQKIHSSETKFVPSIEVKNGEITQINPQSSSSSSSSSEM